MIKYNYKSSKVLPNMTGRRFMCVSKNSELVDTFADNFNIGRIYPEAKVDFDHENITECDKELLLISDNNIPIYIDSCDFVEIEGMNSVAVNSWIYLN